MLACAPFYVYVPVLLRCYNVNTPQSLVSRPYYHMQISTERCTTMPESLHDDYLQRLVTRLAELPTETEWVEFKVNNADPQEIGEYIYLL